MRNHERNFYYFECEISSRTEDARLPTMLELAEVWERHQRNNEAKMAIRKGALSLMISDIASDNASSTLTLLIRTSDRQASNSVYSDIDRGTFRENVKTETEGDDVGAHLIISTIAERTKPNVYLAIFEAVSGLNYRQAKAILNKVLHYQYQQDPHFYEVDDPRGRRTRDGHFRRVRHLPFVNFTGQVSDTLGEDLERGKLTGIKLIKAERNTPVGGVPYLKKEATHLNVSIDNQNLPQRLLTSATRALSRESATYSTAQISFKMPRKKRSVTVKLDTVTGNPIDELYIRSSLITNVRPLLARSSERIVTHLVDQAKPILIAGRDV